MPGLTLSAAVARGDAGNRLRISQSVWVPPAVSRSHAYQAG